MIDQAVQQIINELPIYFVNRIMECNDVKQLQKELHRHQCYNRRAVIKARIENINYLVS